MVSYPTSEVTADRNTRCLHCRIQEPLQKQRQLVKQVHAETLQAAVKAARSAADDEGPAAMREPEERSMQRCLPVRETFSLPSRCSRRCQPLGVGVTGTRCGLTPLPIDDARTPAATVVDDWAISLVSVGEIMPALLRLKMVSGDLPRLGGGTLRRVQVSWLLWSPRSDNKHNLVV